MVRLWGDHVTAIHPVGGDWVVAVQQFAGCRVVFAWWSYGGWCCVVAVGRPIGLAGDRVVAE